jgi:hypothetical protein
VIPVYFHIVTFAGQGGVYMYQIESQMAVSSANTASMQQSLHVGASRVCMQCYAASLTAGHCFSAADGEECCTTTACAAAAGLSQA